MSVLTDLNQITSQAKEISLELNGNSRIATMTEQLSTGVGKAVDKAASYIIKSLPIPDCAKDILVDVKDALKTKDIKSIFSTAVKSSVREGLELLGLNKKSIKDIMNLKDIAAKGGLIFKIKNSIQIVANNFLKNNLTDNYVFKFFSSLKEFVQSGKFMDKLNGVLRKMLEKKDKFLEQIKKWYTSYENLDFESMTNIAQKLKRQNDVLELYPDCAKENSVIQNVTKMANNKNDKLSEIQLQLCNTL
ncbi:MAG: hypothetical protein IKV94_02110 [Clostridia bacterium]|nr:hypothetical protein [Clostridia bacterium]